jgi:hypothetical protein
MYNRMRLVPQAVDPACAGLDGLLWINAAGDLRLCLGGLGGPPSAVWTQNDTTDMVYITDLNSGANPLLQVGIGTSNAQAMLHILGLAAQPPYVLRLDSSGGVGVGMEFWNNIVTRHNTINSNITNALSISDGGGTQRFVITQAGNVGIGVPVPLSNVQTAGNIWAQGNIYAGQLDLAMGQLVAFGNNVGSTQGGRISLEASANWDTTFNSWVIESYQDDLRIYRDLFSLNPSLYFDEAGNSAVYGTPIAGHKLTVRGDLYVDASITAHAFFYISDEQFKENIRAVKGWDTVKQLNGVEFDWKDTKKKGIGLVAQDVEKVLPELINVESSSGIKSVSYGNLIAPLIETVKEQQVQIESLRKQIKDLKAQQF